ncbi:hypothetical protein D3C77_34660 [compost metagenome]
MSNSRIKGRYTRSMAEASLGAARWLDLVTGKLYMHPHDKYSVLDGFTETSPGIWETAYYTWEMDKLVPPDEPPAPQKDAQAFKADDGKPNWYLLMSAKGCAKALAGIVRVLSFAVAPKERGGKGYAEHSWREVPNAKERYESALHRHMSAIQCGETHDVESKESHWYHVATNAMFLAELHNAEEKQ